MYFRVLGPIGDIETFAISNSIRELARLNRRYGAGRWRKRKGLATVGLADGSVVLAELHWYECQGIGKREMKIKHLLA